MNQQNYIIKFRMMHFVTIFGMERQAQLFIFLICLDIIMKLSVCRENDAIASLTNRWNC